MAAKGNRAGSSRRSRVAWREAFDRACSPDDLEAIVRRAVADAKKGDRHAREVVLAYCLQKPPRQHDLTLVEGHDIDPSKDPGDAYYD